MSRYSRQLFPFCTLVLIFALWSVLAPEHFLSVRNLLNILRGASVTGDRGGRHDFRRHHRRDRPFGRGDALAVRGRVGGFDCWSFRGPGLVAIENGIYVPLNGWASRPHRARRRPGEPPGF